MAVTAPTDVQDWVPSLISSKVYDLSYESDRALSSFAEVYPDLEGKAGETFTIPRLNSTTPADNLAVTTAATDDKLSGDGVDVTIKEAVKSVAFYDRTKWATGTDFNAIAGSRAGSAVQDRIELDLGAAAFAGRNTAADTTAATLTLAGLLGLRGKIPAKLRRKGLVFFAEEDVLAQLLADTTVNNAAAFGSDEAIREGDFSRPIYGIRLRAVDDGVLPPTADATPKRRAMLTVPGGLVRVVQKGITSEVERDARARLTRVVATALHGEGVADSRAVAFLTVG